VVEEERIEVDQQPLAHLQRGFGGAGLGGPGRRGGRAGFGTGGAGVVLRRAQPSTFCRDARPFILLPDPPAAAATAGS
jgi:hypothetical protein